jgi:murein DD-endopeptidase MepM/ murein hydrolase activator NlpD
MKNKSKTEKKRKSFLRKYRLVILDESSYEERFSLKLSRFNVFLWTGTSSIFLVVMTILLISYSSLREYIPGYASTELRRSAINLNVVTDSLRKQINQQENFISRIQLVLNGALDFDTLGKLSSLDYLSKKPDVSLFSPSEKELALRKKVKTTELSLRKRISTDSDFQIPLVGALVTSTNLSRKSYGISIEGIPGQKIFPFKEGTILTVEGTPSLGYVMIIQHTEGGIGRYSRIAEALKKTGDFVRKDDVLGLLHKNPEDETFIGHFEYWLNGESLDLKKLLGLK